MSANKNNNIFEKTSFLGNNSSEFVETLYDDYLKNPSNLPEEWKNFFEGLNDKEEKIIKNFNGPSWSPKKKIKSNILNNKINLETKNGDLSNSVVSGSILDAAKDSVRANMLIRAYRIRGHLIANLDPLRLQEREEHTELKPETYGFTSKDFNKKIFLDGVMGLQSSTLKEIISLAKKTYCQKIGFEYMHMGDPAEKIGLEIELRVKKRD